MRILEEAAAIQYSLENTMISKYGFVNRI